MIVNGKEVYGVIYKIRNKINNKVYIGQTAQKNGFKGRYCCKGNGVERVYNYYKSLKQSRSINIHLFRAIEKYGFDNFEVDEVFDSAYSKEELNKLEYMYIKVFNLTNSKYGYNNMDGGGSGKHSTESTLLDGVSVYCLNNKRIYRSYTEASKDIGKSTTWIKARIINRRVNDVEGYINGELKFRIVDEKFIDKFNSGFSVCCCCGSWYKRKKIIKYGYKKYYYNGQKYCSKCKGIIKNKKSHKHKLIT